MIFCEVTLALSELAYNDLCVKLPSLTLPIPDKTVSMEWSYACVGSSMQIVLEKPT